MAVDQHGNHHQTQRQQRRNEALQLIVMVFRQPVSDAAVFKWVQQADKLRDTGLAKVSLQPPWTHQVAAHGRLVGDSISAPCRSCERDGNTRSCGCERFEAMLFSRSWIGNLKRTSVVALCTVGTGADSCGLTARRREGFPLAVGKRLTNTGYRYEISPMREFDFHVLRPDETDERLDHSPVNVSTQTLHPRSSASSRVSIRGEQCE